MSFRSGAAPEPLLGAASGSQLASQGQFGGRASQAVAISDELMLQQENSPAYKALHDAGLIVHAYRLKNPSELQVEPANSTMGSNVCQRCLAYTAGVVVGGIVYDSIVKSFSVNDGCIRLGSHKDGSYLFYGAGVHRRLGIFVRLGQEVPLTRDRIEHGNRTIVTVPQGFVGLCFDRGQPIILAPGMHQWKSDTMKLQELIDLMANVIRIGPFTLITVDEGYSAITQDNGKQKVLPGGATHMLTHRNWKFEKFISLKIHTDDLGPFRATTADNVVLETVATVNWRVDDAAVAARMAAETMGQGGAPAQNRQGDTSYTDHTPTLRRDVLKQAMASLAAAVGGVRYADDLHIAAVDKAFGGAASSAPQKPQNQQGGDAVGLSQIFSQQHKTSAAKHANEICHQYGVCVVSISVISAVPVDKKLEEALSCGAVAAAGAQQAELAARGNAKAKLISSQADAEALRINAQARADAERIEAQGKADGAKALETSAVAVDLAKLERAAMLVGDKTAFFFGANPHHIPNMLANPKVVNPSGN